MGARLIHELQMAIGTENVVVDADLRGGHETDWTGRWGGAGLSDAVVRPRTTAAVAAALAVCDGAGVAVVPQGGNTGLVGGSVPRRDLDRKQVILSTESLDWIDEVDTASATISCGAGAVLADVQDAAAAAGLELGADLGARGSATIGGMVATNAGGIRVLRHGPMADQVVRVEAVLPDGSLVGRSRGPVKDNTGYRWGGILGGSEGTLGVVTGVQLRLGPPAPATARQVAILGVSDFPAASRLCALARSRASISAVEVFDDTGLALVRDHLSLPSPLRRPAAVQVLLEGAEDDLVAIADDPAVGDTAVATDAPAAAALWRYREELPAAIAAHGIPHKLDIAVAPAAIAELVAGVRRIGPEVVLFGHLGDGNLHVNVLGVEPGDESVDTAVLEIVAGLGGSISAEHGIGVAKAAHLHLARTGADIAAMHRLKRALDPKNTLNPGVIFAAGVRP